VTVSQICVFWAGVVCNTLTFGLGMAVGISLLKRKESLHDDRNEGPKQGEGSDV
jgi:hypothetical protein